MALGILNFDDFRIGVEVDNSNNKGDEGKP